MIYNDSPNILFMNKYIISEKLHYALEHSSLNPYIEPSHSDPAIELSASNPDIVNSNNKKNKEQKGIYLVMFRLLNLKTKVLVYNYVYYPDFFLETLIVYLSSRCSTKPSIVVRE